MAEPEAELPETGGGGGLSDGEEGASQEPPQKPIANGAVEFAGEEQEIRLGDIEVSRATLTSRVVGFDAAREIAERHL